MAPQVELSRTKLKEAVEKSFVQRGCMEDLQIRLEDDKKVSTADHDFPLRTR
jgi:hypothetical protein